MVPVHDYIIFTEWTIWARKDANTVEVGCQAIMAHRKSKLCDSFFAGFIRNTPVQAALPTFCINTGSE